jgi:hypothetical protein
MEEVAGGGEASLPCYLHVFKSESPDSARTPTLASRGAIDDMEEVVSGQECPLPKYPHIFKSDSPNSARLRDTVATANAIVGKRPLSHKAFHRLEKKKARLGELTVVATPAAGILEWDGSSVVYMRGGPTEVTDCHLEEGHVVLDATTAPMVLQSDRGVVVKDVCILLPRDESGSIYSTHSWDAFVALETATKKNSKARGHGRCPVGTDKYMTVGTKACRNKHGLVDGMSILRGLPAVHKELSRIMRNVEHRVIRWIDTMELKFLEESKILSGYTGFMFHGNDGRSSKIWPSLACARNTYLPLHTDEDYFLSAVSVYSRRQTKDIVLQYFCFPTLGIHVAMRNGDFLLFNPKVPHCISSPTSNIHDSFSMSVYLKTIVVSGNSNLPRTTREEA